MSVQAVTVTSEDAARRRIGATAALAALVTLLVLISLVEHVARQRGEPGPGRPVAERRAER